MSRWRRLTRAGGLAVGAAAASATAVLAVEKIAVGRLRLRPDPAADEPLGQLRGRPLTVVTDDGVPLHVEVSGPDDAPVAIIFSHGYTLNQDCWHFQRQALAGVARIVCWDQRGHGRSGWPEASDHDPGEAHHAPHASDPANAEPGRPEPGDAGADHAAAEHLDMERPDPEHSDLDHAGLEHAGLADVDHDRPGHVTIDRLGADLGAVLAATVPGDGRALLVGHSLGGMTVMALATAQPELFGTKVVGTVLISTAAARVDPTGWLPAPLRPVARQAAPAVLRGASRGRPAALVERGRQAAGDIAFLSTRFIAFGDPGTSPALVDFLERIIRATPVRVISEFYLALVDHDQRAALGILGQVPAVVLTGDRDRIVAPRLTGELAAGIPGADLILVPGAGHVLILERPDVVNEAITAMVARVTGPASTEPASTEPASTGPASSGSASSGSANTEQVSTEQGGS